MKRKKSATDVVYDKCREVHYELLDAAFKEKFNVPVETRYNIIPMRMVTNRSDGGKFTKAQREWIDTWTAGYNACMEAM